MKNKLFLFLLIMAAPLACRLNPAKGPPRRDAATTSQPAATAVHSKGDEEAESIVFDDLPLPDGIQALAKEAEINIQFDPALLNQKAADGTLIPPPDVKARWKNVSPNQALQALLWNYGWQMDQTPNNPIVRIRARDPKAPGPPLKIVNLLAKAPPAAAAAGSPAHLDPGDEVAESLVFNDLPLPDAIRQLAVLAGLNIQFDPRLSQLHDASHHPIPPPNVNEKMTNLSPSQAIQTLLDKYGWLITQLPGNPILRIVARDPKAPDAVTSPSQLR